MSVNLNGLGETELKTLSGSLHHLIDHIAARIEYAESRRGSISAIAAAMLAADIALLTFGQASIQLKPLWFAIVAFSITGIGLSILIWITYARQTNFDYPFKSVTDTWKWFYRNALLDVGKFGANHFGGQSKSAQAAARQAFIDQREAFRTKQIPGLSDPKSSTDQDLEQVYVLHINERYKNLFLTHLRNILAYGLLINVLIGLVTFISTLYYFKPLMSVASGAYSTSDIEVTASWRDTGAKRTIGAGAQEIELLINVRIRNKATSSLPINGLIPKDNYGMQLPIYVQSLTPPSMQIPIKTEAQFVGTVWIPESVRSDLHHFEIKS
ncbi:MAG: hypothetical protein AB7P69_25465 [Candidatus Binatia bacterium]